MELGNILEFRKDLYFEGAVQADWFYSPERAAKVAENFVFHGNQYFGIEDQGVGNKKRIDTISLVSNDDAGREPEGWTFYRGVREND